MKRSVLLFTASLALLVSLAAALAATDPETPNDPAVNPNANACYTGGSMAGKCKLDEQIWTAGWYAIRFQHGLISRDQIPDPYKWVLPAADEPGTIPTSPPLLPTATKLPL